MNIITPFDPQASPLGGIIHTNGVNKDEQLMLYNDSPVGILLTFQNNDKGIIPAYWNKDFIIDRPMGDVTWTVLYTLLTPTQYPVSTFYGEIYESQEHKTSANSAINRGVVVTGGSVTATTSGATSLTNDGNAAGSPFIESTVLGQTVSSINITNDGITIIREIIAGALTQVLKLSSSDPIVSLGAIGHNVEVLGNTVLDNGLNVGVIRDNVNGNVTLDLSAGDGSIKISGIALLTHILGNLTVDGTTTLSGILTAPAANDLGAVSVLTHILGNLTVEGTVTHNGLLFQVGTSLFTTNPRLNSKRIDDGAGNALIDWSGTFTKVNGGISTPGPFQYYANGTNMDWRHFGESAFGATGNVTVNHGLKYKGAGLTPQSIIACQGINAVGSQTMGASSTGATQTTITTGAGLAWTAYAQSS